MNGSETGSTGAPVGVAALVPVRLASQRCKNKALRPFGDTTLTRLALEKAVTSRAVNTVYFAAHEEELLAVAADFPSVRVIRRTRASAYGEDALTIYDFMREIAEPVIATLSICAPFVRMETYDRAIEEYRRQGYRSLMPVVPSQEWQFDAEGRPLQLPDRTAISSKLLPLVYRAAHPFTIFNRLEFLKDYRVWRFEPEDPHLFEIGEEEAIDIDTEFQFEAADALYRYRRARASLPTTS